MRLFQRIRTRIGLFEAGPRVPTEPMEELPPAEEDEDWEWEIAVARARTASSEDPTAGSWLEDQTQIVPMCQLWRGRETALPPARKTIIGVSPLPPMRPHVRLVPLAHARVARGSMPIVGHDDERTSESIAYARTMLADGDVDA